jgi:putative membrane protein
MGPDNCRPRIGYLRRSEAFDAVRQGARWQVRPFAGRRQPALRDVGTDPDYRFTLANERTFLAWIRTALALIAGGAAVTSLLPQLGVKGIRAALGLVLLLLGMTVAAVSYRRWDRNERALRLGTALPPTSLTGVMAGGVVLVALALMVMIVLGRR